MTKENVITVLDLARMELESAYKRLGYSNSNVLTSINESIVNLQREALSQAAVSGSVFKGKVHKKVHSNTITNYYFTKDKNNCLMIEYDNREDYGEHSTSGTWISRVIFHQNNSFIKKELTEIKLSEVPQSMIRILQYLC